MLDKHKYVCILVSIACIAILTMKPVIDIDAAELKIQIESATLLGDINSDGMVNFYDDELFKNYFAGNDVSIHYLNADVNEDNMVSRKDAMILARHLAGWEGYSSLGAESERLPWEIPGAKQPNQYTWAEFYALDGMHQIAFQNYFSSFEEFEKWMENAQAEKLPWEIEGGKQPTDYSWEEFEALDGNQQIAFQNSFSNFDEFEAWLQNAKAEANKLPWENPNSKQPIDYTYAEFEQLTGDLQIAFQNSFESFEEFEAWLKKAKEEVEKFPWELPDGKQPEDYSWEDFLALTPDQSIAFQSAFKEADGFEKWLDENEP